MRHKSGLALPRALLALLIGSSVAAQDQGTAAGDFFDVSPLILIVTRMSRPLLDSPASVSVIDRQMIEASGVRELADLFRLVPGFVADYHSGHASTVGCTGLGEEFSRRVSRPALRGARGERFQPRNHRPESVRGFRGLPIRKPARAGLLRPAVERIPSNCGMPG